MFTLTFVDHEYDTSITSWDIWNDDRILMIDLLLFELASRLNSQNTYETEIHNEMWHINLYFQFVFPIAIIEGTTPRKWSFWHYIISLHDYWLQSTWNSLVYNSWGEMERCEKRAFQFLKMQKKKISWKIKNLRNGLFIHN